MKILCVKVGMIQIFIKRLYFNFTLNRTYPTPTWTCNRFGYFITCRTNENNPQQEVLDYFCTLNFYFFVFHFFYNFELFLKYKKIHYVQIGIIQIFTKRFYFNFVIIKINKINCEMTEI